MGVKLSEVAVPALTRLVEVKTSMAQPASLKRRKVTLPLGLEPPETVAVSRTGAPSRLPGNAWVSFLAGCGAKVGTRCRHLSGIRFAHKTRDLHDPTAAARVTAVWEGIRRTHGAPAEQAAPLVPPELWDVIDRCPTLKTWKTAKRPPEPDLTGLRDGRASVARTIRAQASEAVRR